MFRLLISFMLISTLSFAQEKNYYALTVPGQPIKQGQTITLNYTPAKTNLAKETGDITAIASVYTQGNSNGYDIAFKPGRRGTYTATFTLSDSADAVAFQIRRGKGRDNNEGNGYYFPVMDASGNAVPNTNFSLGAIAGGDNFSGVENPKTELSKTYYTRWMNDAGATKQLTDQLRVATITGDTATICRLAESYKSLENATTTELSQLMFYAREYCKK